MQDEIDATKLTKERRRAVMPETLRLLGPWLQGFPDAAFEAHEAGYVWRHNAPDALAIAKRNAKVADRDGGR